MAGGSLPEQSRAGAKKKIKTILPQKSPADGPTSKSSASESESSEEEEEARVINDYDYEALEDIWLKAGEIEAKDLSFSENRRKSKEGEKGRKRGGSTDEEWKMEEKEEETSERKKLSQNKSKSPKPGSKRSENEIEISSQSEEEGDVPAPGQVPARKPMEYMFPLANKNLVRPSQTQQTKPDPGFESAFLNFCNKKAEPAASQTAPMIRVDYSKHLEAGSSLSSTIEKLSRSLCSPASASAPASVPQSGPGRVLSLLLESGMRPGQPVSLLQRGWAGGQVTEQALDQLVSEVTQLRQLRSQMSPTHRQLLTHSSQADSAHQAAALAILARLPPHQLQQLHSRLEVSSPPVTSWTGSLEHSKAGWRLTVRPPEPGLSHCFSLEAGQVADLGLDSVGSENTASQ